MIEIATSAAVLISATAMNELIEFAVESYNRCRRHGYDDYTNCKQYLNLYAEIPFSNLCNTCHDIDPNLLSISIQEIIGASR